MKQKGFYTAIISLTIIVLLSTMMAVQQNVSRNIQTESYQRAIIELKTGTQNAQYLLDKAAADAMSDAILLEDCGQTSEYVATINEYFNGKTGGEEGIIPRLKEFYGIECKPVLVMPADITETPGATINIAILDFGFDLDCYKTLPNGFKIEYAKTVTFNKELRAESVDQGPGLLPKCKVQVKDLQSGTCDAVINKEASECV